MTAPAPTIGVLALQGDVREHLAMLDAVGARATPVRRPGELAQVDGIVIPGGESSTIDKLLRAFDLFGPLRDALAGGLPAYGSCAGMILLASRVLDGIDGQRSLGALDVTVRRNAFGRQVDSFEARLDSAAFDDAARDVARERPGQSTQPLHAVFIRAPWVEEVGPGAEALATVATGPAAGRIVAVRGGSGGGKGPVLATSFHPEITADLRVHRLFVRIVRDAS